MIIIGTELHPALDTALSLHKFWYLLSGLEAVLQADGAVEDQMRRGGILAVGAEVAQTHKLEGSRCLGIFQSPFYLTTSQNFQRIGVQAGDEILACGIGIGIIKQIGILSDLCIAAVVRIYPVDGGTLNLATVSGIAALGIGVVGGKNFYDIAVFVLYTAGTLNHICTLQTALRSFRVQPLVLGDGFCQEVVRFDPQIPGEGDSSGTQAEPGFPWILYVTKRYCIPLYLQRGCLDFCQ